MKNKTKKYATFKRMATLVRKYRREKDLATGNFSQKDLSKMLGLKNGQYISNVERGMCSISAIHAKKLSALLGVSTEQIAKAFAEDQYESYLTEANSHELT